MGTDDRYMNKHKTRQQHSQGTRRTHPAPDTDMGKALASYYSTGNTTANGDRFNPKHFTGAHKTLEFGSIVRVTPDCEEGEKGRSLLIYINDDGPNVRGRKLDVTSGAAKHLCMKDDGTARLKMKYLGNAEKSPGLFHQWAQQPGQGFAHVPDNPDDLQAPKRKPAHTKRGRH